MTLYHAYERARDENLDAVRRAGNGSRNNTLNRAAFATAQLAKAAGFEMAAEKRKLIEAAKTCGLDEREAGRTVDSAWKDGEANPRTIGNDNPRYDIRPGHAVRLNAGQKIVATYIYGEAGKVHYRKHRVEPGDDGRDKSFRFDHPDGRGGWAWGAGKNPIPYRVDDLRASSGLIIMTEGEKHADKLAGWGFNATSFKGWKPEFAQYIAGRPVVILPDHGDDGASQASKALEHVEAAGCYGRIVHLPGLKNDGDDIMDWAGNSDDLRELVAPLAVSEAQSSIKRSDALEYEWAGAIEPQLFGFWLIKKLLPAHGLALLYGHPGSGKTFLALDFGFHVAMGWDWQGKKTKQGLVVYVAAEGARGLRNRVAAFKAHHGIKATDPFPLAIVPSPIDMQAANADTPRLAETIREACAACGFDPALVIIDTISKTFGGGKENTDDMVTYVANCGRIAAEFDCCVMPVHHRPKDAESEDPRGHSSLRGGSDTIIICEAGKPKRARIKKQKDGEEGDVFHFDLVPVELGLDEDGEPVTSCYVQQARASAAPALDPRIKALGALSDGQRRAFNCLGEAIAHHGHAVPTDIPDHVINRFMVAKVTPITVWRDMFISTGRTGGGQATSSAGGQGADKEADTLGRTFRRYKEKLQATGIIGVWEDYAWIAHGSSNKSGQAADTPRTGGSPMADRADTPSSIEGCPVRLGDRVSGAPFSSDPHTDLDANGDIVGWNEG